MSVTLLWVVSPTSKVSTCLSFLDSSKNITARNKKLVFNGRPKKGMKQKWKTTCNFPVISNVVANPAAVSSEQKVYDVVLKQAALVKRQMRSSADVKPDIVLPGSLSLLSEAYDRCGEVCAEYAKTFYLG